MIIDTYILYEFIKRLTTPFVQMQAFSMGLIDQDGKFLKKRENYTFSEKQALTLFDVLIINLKKLIGRIPGGSSQIGTFAAALLLLREHKNIKEDNIENIIFELDNNLKMCMEEVITAMPGAPTNTTAGVEGLLPNGLKVTPVSKMHSKSIISKKKYKKKNIKDTKFIMSLIRRRSANLVGVKEETSLRYNKELNPKLWDNTGKLKQIVKDKLLEISNAWIKYTRISSDNVYDVVITGGNVNFNYTDSSDIDLHVVISRNNINQDREFVDEYLQDKKILWTLQHPNISIYGYSVELYAQDIDDKPHANQGVYSLVQDKWIARPQMLDLDFENDHHLQKKVQFFKDMIDQMIKDNANDEAIDILKDKLRNLRSDCLKDEGEFCFGNLIFKELRNTGYLDKINTYKKTKQDKALSLGNS